MSSTFSVLATASPHTKNPQTENRWSKIMGKSLVELGMSPLNVKDLLLLLLLHLVAYCCILLHVGQDRDATCCKELVHARGVEWFGSGIRAQPVTWSEARSVSRPQGSTFCKGGCSGNRV